MKIKRDIENAKICMETTDGTTSMEMSGRLIDILYLLFLFVHRLVIDTPNCAEAVRGALLRAIEIAQEDAENGLEKEKGNDTGV